MRSEEAIDEMLLVLQVHRSGLIGMAGDLVQISSDLRSLSTAVRNAVVLNKAATAAAISALSSNLELLSGQLSAAIVGFDRIVGNDGNEEVDPLAETAPIDRGEVAAANAAAEDD